MVCRPFTLVKLLDFRLFNIGLLTWRVRNPDVEAM